MGRPLPPWIIGGRGLVLGARVPGHHGGQARAPAERRDVRGRAPASRGHRADPQLVQGERRRGAGWKGLVMEGPVAGRLLQGGGCSSQGSAGARALAPAALTTWQERVEALAPGRRGPAGSRRVQGPPARRWGPERDSGVLRVGGVGVGVAAGRGTPQPQPREPRPRSCRRRQGCGRAPLQRAAQLSPEGAAKGLRGDPEMQGPAEGPPSPGRQGPGTRLPPQGHGGAGPAAGTTSRERLGRKRWGAGGQYPSWGLVCFLKISEQLCWEKGTETRCREAGGQDPSLLPPSSERCLDVDRAQGTPSSGVHRPGRPACPPCVN